MSNNDNSNNNNSNNNIEQEIEESQRRTNQKVRQFVQISFEREATNQVAVLKETIDTDNSDTSASTSSTTPNLNNEYDTIYVSGCSSSVGTVIKVEALSRQRNYNSLDCNNKAVAALGLNSILDLSSTYPHSQATLFTRGQWKQLRARFPCRKYDTDQYSSILEPLNIISTIYDDRSSFDINWIKLYKELKQLRNKYDPNIQPEHNDTGFCIDLLLHILSTVKHQPHLFNDGIGVSEWDYIVKFWGVVTERLFHHSDLRLKWGDTHLTVSDTISDLLLKVDMRVLHDSVRQRFNVETDLGVLEAAEEDPGDVKYTSDRCKVTIESKAIIDKFVLDGCLIDSVDSLQVSGLELHFGRTTLARPGLYVADQFHTTAIDKSLNNISRYFDLACHLLCFRDQCIQIYNKYEDHLTNSRTKKTATKRNIQDLPEDELVLKQNYIRGSWSPPRTSKTTPPPPPKKLFGTTE